MTAFSNLFRQALNRIDYHRHCSCLALIENWTTWSVTSNEDSTDAHDRALSMGNACSQTDDGGPLRIDPSLVEEYSTSFHFSNKAKTLYFILVMQNLRENITLHFLFTHCSEVLSGMFMILIAPGQEKQRVFTRSFDIEHEQKVELWIVLSYFSTSHQGYRDILQC